MKVIEHLERASEPLISYEIIPPKRGGSIQGVFDTIESIMPFNPPFIDVTSHAAEIDLQKQPGGVYKKRIKRKRPGTIGLCAAIEHRFKVDAVPHLLCQGFTRQETEDALIELNYLGIENVLAIRGDDPGYQKELQDGRTRNEYAIDLVNQIHEMNNGNYLEDLANATPTDFCIGVAGYPEKHFEAPNLDWDIQQTKAKIEAGADYIVTQMFFDNQRYFDYLDRCREAGIEVPIIPGLKILTSKRHISFLPRYFHIDLPEELSQEVAAAEGASVSEIGIEWALNQTMELLEAGVPAIHFYIMQSSTVASQVVRKVTGTSELFAVPGKG
ncbi:MAG: methylenetetrahydrofolate reductase [NAD(P)H] [Candidatus Marinimicrobia bacterium]|nr:methylenetetrahydrofolate reductase [NAD(P)H] [Candidatus Neomarinimicrobiota bacterium]MCF7880576.1 methylenetetrahydrofolate reductase [NAD(P)H] [Candidatus Neomarinimicrobiota bacterium]